MSRLFTHFGKIALTIAFVAAAVVGLILVWQHYERDPWTRDGKVQADIVQVAPDVTGLVTRVLVHDNQPVVPGQVLFVVDNERYRAQLAQADASIASAKAQYNNAVRERARYLSLGDLVSQETRDQRVTQADQARAMVEQAVANRAVAALNLRRSEVRARVAGYVTGFSMRPGDYVTSGQAQFALVDVNSYYVLGYFEETKLHRFRIGERAQVTLLGDDRPMYGHVVSIAAGIADREQSASPEMLPNVNPTFSWIRLAQRVPVRVVIDQVPVNLRLIVGRTATVTVLPTADPHVMPGRADASRLPANTVPIDGRPPIAAPAGTATGAVVR